jgi:hypothetical protein
MTEEEFLHRLMQINDTHYKERFELLLMFLEERDRRITEVALEREKADRNAREGINYTKNDLRLNLNLLIAIGGFLATVILVMVALKFL